MVWHVSVPPTKCEGMLFLAGLKPAKNVLDPKGAAPRLSVLYGMVGIVGDIKYFRLRVVLLKAVNDCLTKNICRIFLLVELSLHT